MADWNRFGEEKKYKNAADTNVNPKHVGESLRQLSMEDRLELRRQARERAKRTLQAEVDDDDEEAKAAEEALDRAFKKPKIEGTVVIDNEVDLTCEGKEVDALDPPSSTSSARDPTGGPRGQEPDITVVGEDNAADAVPPSQTRTPGRAPAEVDGGAERRQPLARTSSADQHPPLRRTSSQRSASVVEDLGSTVLDLDDSGAVPQNSPAPSDSSAAANRRARRRASAAKAAATPGPGPQAGSAAAAPAAKARPAASADAPRVAPRCIQLVE